MFSERLQRAIDRSGHSVRQTGISLSERGVPGASYGNIRRMLAGDAEKSPTVDFIEAAADFLGVRRAWLAFGDGAMTEAEQEAAELEAEEVEGEFSRTAADVIGGVLDGYGIPRVSDDQVGGWDELDAMFHRQPGLRTWLVPALVLSSRANLTPEQVGEMLRTSLAALGLEPNRMSVEDLDRYTLATLVALLTTVAPSMKDATGEEPRPQRTRAEIEEAGRAVEELEAMEDATRKQAG